jgi:hypothetical protein
MSRLAVAALVVCTACQGGKPSSEAWKETGYGRDMEKVCNAMKESGAAEQPEETRMIMIARWLGKNLETNKMHAFLVKIQPLAPDEKAAAFEAEARSVGLADCPIAREWTK